jgi:hypothetical protein
MALAGIESYRPDELKSPLSSSFLFSRSLHVHATRTERRKEMLTIILALALLFGGTQIPQDSGSVTPNDVEQGGGTGGH